MKKLIGSERQIAWAEDIRNDFLECADEMIALQKERATTGDTDRNKLEGRIAATGLWNDYRSKLNEVQREILMPTKKEREKMPEEECAETKKAVQTKRANRILDWMKEAVKERLEEESAAVWIENRMR